jgi:glycosyltransferase involved in cell wall biosynthesis
LTRTKRLPKKIIYLELLDSLLEEDGGILGMQYRMALDVPWMIDEGWEIERWGLRRSKRRSSSETIRFRGWALPSRLPHGILAGFVWATQFTLALLRPRSGIMLAFSPLMGAGVATARLIRPSIVLVVRIYGSASSKAVLMNGRPGKGRLLRLIERFVLRRANLVIPVSSFTHQVAIDAGIPEKRLLLLPAYWHRPEAVSYGRKEGPPRVVCVGRLVPEKAFDVLIRAFAEVAVEFPSATLEVVGSGPERAALEALVEGLGLYGTVRFHGFVPDNRIQRLYGEALVKVLPSRIEEGFGMALVEAGLAGCALIGTDLGGIRDIVDQGQTGLLVPPNDPGALAEALKKLLREPDEARRLGAEARTRSLEYVRQMESGRRKLRERMEQLRSA